MTTQQLQPNFSSISQFKKEYLSAHEKTKESVDAAIEGQQKIVKTRESIELSDSEMKTELNRLKLTFNSDVYEHGLSLFDGVTDKGELGQSTITLFNRLLHIQNINKKLTAFENSFESLPLEKPIYDKLKSDYLAITPSWKESLSMFAKIDEMEDKFSERYKLLITQEKQRIREENETQKRLAAEKEEKSRKFKSLMKRLLLIGGFVAVVAVFLLKQMSKG